MKENKMKLDIIYNSNIEFDGDSDKEEFKMPLPVKGVSFVTGYIEKKGIIIPHEEGDNIAASLIKGIDGLGAYILKDHGFKSIMILAPKSVDLLVGRVKNAVRLDNNILYSGEISVDEDLAQKVYQKLVTSSSVGLHLGRVECSICGRDYMDEECTHQFGKEYPKEGLHKSVAEYKDAVGGDIAVPVGRDVSAREQSIVLFPAIKGASIGVNFTEESEKLLAEIIKNKGSLEELTKMDLLKEARTLILVMSEEKAGQKELLEEYREKLDEQNNMILELQKEVKDHTEIKNMLLELQKQTGETHEVQGLVGRENTGISEQKEDVRELIFGKRKDGQALKNIRKLI